MLLKKLLSILLLLAVSITVFTACEDDPSDPLNPTVTSDPVSNVFAGQVAANSIQVQWDHSPSQSKAGFQGYRVTVTGGSTTAEEVNTLVTDKMFLFTAAQPGVVYTFSIVTEVKTLAADEETDSIITSSTQTIKWATAKHFTQNDMNGEIKIYVGESSDYGSGFCIYDAAGQAPTMFKVAQGAKWNLALGKKTNLVFGTASEVVRVVDYNITGTPADAEITSIMGNGDQPWDLADGATNDAMLNGLMLSQDLTTNGFDFSKKTVDLTNDPRAKNAKNGIILFARIGSGSTAHYAKIVILKKNGMFLQGGQAGNDQYIQALVSYQTAAGVPYAKIIANK